MTDTPRIAAVGDNCVDWYEESGTGFAGGNPVNVAVSVVRAGGRASYTGVVGQDRGGSLIVDSLRREGVDVSHVRVVPGRTAVTQVQLVDGERVFGEYEEGVMASFRLTAEDIDFLASHDLVVSGLWGHVEDQLDAVSARGVPIAFDCADHLERPEAERAIPFTDICFFSGSSDDAPLRRRMAEIAARGPHTVVATLGGNGSIALRDGVFTHCGVQEVQVVDTMGAGDSFIGGFLRSWLTSAPLADCLAAGTASAARTLQVEGAW